MRLLKFNVLSSSSNYTGEAYINPDIIEAVCSYFSSSRNRTVTLLKTANSHEYTLDEPIDAVIAKLSGTQHPHSVKQSL